MDKHIRLHTLSLDIVLSGVTDDGLITDIYLYTNGTYLSSNANIEQSHLGDVELMDVDILHAVT